MCRRDDSLRGRDGDEIPKLQSETLYEHGVDPSQVRLIPDERKAVDAALAAARPDDLLLIFCDAIARTWDQITSFSVDGDARPADEIVPARPELAPAPEVSLEGERLVRDERGVRVAREIED